VTLRAAAGDDLGIEALGITETASRESPARSRTSASGTPRQRATPIAPSFHGVPGTGVFCTEPKYQRPLPAHSIAAVIVRAGMPSRSARENETGAAADPIPTARAGSSRRRSRAWPCPDGVKDRA
jgi:hypothetical protein